MISFSESLNQGYEWDTDNIDGDGEIVEYQASFKAKTGHFYVMLLAHLKANTIRIDFSNEDGDSTITGESGTDAMKIFATLGDVVRKALIQHPGFAVQFEGYNDEPSKVKLYRALANRCASLMHGTVTTKQHHKNTRFIITPPKIRPNR